jgi:hypothetical protein
VGDHLWTPLARRVALLGEPAAFGPDRAVWWLVGNDGKQPYDLGGERASLVHEVVTRTAYAWCRRPQDLRCGNRMREFQEVLRHRYGGLQEVGARLVDTTSDHSDEKSSIHLGLRTGA